MATKKQTKATGTDFKDYKTVGIIAVKGGGKTIKMLSEAAKMEKVIMCDALGVMNPRNDYRSGILPNSNYYTKRQQKVITAGNQVKKETSAVDVFINEFKRVETETAIKRHVIDFSESKNRAEDMDTLLNFVKKEAQQNKNAYPLMIDECQLFFPQREHASRDAVEFFQSCRNWGIKPAVLATQRPQSTDKAVLELCDVFLLGANLGLNTVSQLEQTAGVDQDTLNNMPSRSFYNTETKKIEETPTYDYANQQ